MSAKGYCYDNAFSESAFASLKSEVLSEGLPFDSKRAATHCAFRLLRDLLPKESVKKSGVKPPGPRVCDSKVRSRCPGSDLQDVYRGSVTPDFLTLSTNRGFLPIPAKRYSLPPG